MDNINRREFLAGLAAAPLAGTQQPKPNIIFILADDLGYFDLGCYGQKKIKTPNIDRLAAEGTRFTQVYAGGAVCAPSRCCLMTGLHTGHARIRNNHSLRSGERVSLTESDQTVAQVLKKSGYETAIFGKWGLAEPDTAGVPTRKGFDEWLGFLNQDHAVDYYTDYLWRGEKKEVLRGNLNGGKREYVADFFSREALRFVETRRRNPFFLYLAYTTPHPDHEVPSDAPYTHESWDQEDKNYAAMITRMDGDIGRLMASLRKQGIDDRTLVLFSSDNGAGYAQGFPIFGSKGSFRGKKAELYEGGIRVPMIARWKGRVPEARVSDEPWAFWDFLPTAAELAGAPVPAGLDGISIVPALLGKPQPKRNYFYWETNGKAGFTQAVRLDNWKAVYSRAGDSLELYDLAADPSETRDLAAAQSGVAAKMRAILKTARTGNPEYPVEFKKKKAKKSGG